jgi:hypothetical protein
MKGIDNNEVHWSRITVPTEQPHASTETKTVLTPQAMVELLYRLRGGTFMHATETKGIEDLFSQMNFPTGIEGKEAKALASREGIVIVQRGIAAIRDDARVLLATRNDPHVVTQGGSILTSGSPELPPPSVFGKKVSVDPQPDPKDFSRFGFGLSDPMQTGGIHYFFDVHTLQLTAQQNIASLTKDTVSLVTFEEAAKALKGKSMELSLLKQLRNTHD